MTSVVNLQKKKVSDDERTHSGKCKQQILLINTMRPLWKMTQSTGILLDWVGSPLTSTPPQLMINIKSLCNIFISSIAFFSLSCSFAFIACKIITKLMEPQSNPSVFSVIIGVLFAVPPFISSLNLLMLLFIRKDLAKLIEDFHHFESQQLSFSTNQGHVEFRKRRRNAFIKTISTNLTLFLGASWTFYDQQDQYILFTADHTMANIFPIPVLITFEIMVIFLCLLYQILVDLIPSLIYHHAGIAIAAIHDEINFKENILFKTGNDDSKGILLQIWSKYIRVRQLVKRTDKLFGWMLILDFGIKFFMICLFSYNFLANTKVNQPIDSVTPFIVLVTYIIRLMNSVSLMAKVQESRELLTAQMSVHHNTHWLDMDAEVQKVFCAFKSELSSDQLAASPFGLFSVNNELMLSLFSLIVTYLLILIQLD